MLLRWLLALSKCTWLLLLILSLEAVIRAGRNWHCSRTRPLNPHRIVLILLKWNHMIVILILGVYHVIISNGCTSRGSWWIQRIVSTRNAGGTSKTISRWYSSRLRQAADRNAIFILWKHRCQRLVVGAISSKSLLKCRWHVGIALRHERITYHISKRSQLWVRMHSKVLRKWRSSGNTSTRQRLLIRLSLRRRNAVCP